MSPPLPARIVCVEDNTIDAELLRRDLRDEGHALEIHATGPLFLQAVERAAPDLCLIDLHIPGSSGFELLRQLSRSHPDVPGIVLTGSGDTDSVVNAMKAGAIDYLTKPLDPDRLRQSIRTALRVARQNREIARLRADVGDAWALDHIVGRSAAIEKVRALVRKAAGSSVPTLIVGETGTGKELVARALHAGGPRRDRPFIEVNCAALAESLLESELFGHEKGAFTGAVERRAGSFERADGGTLFLDEIGDMPTATQAKILRSLQEMRFQRVGGGDPVQVDVRVVSATHRDLVAEVRKGRFRSDLVFRINALLIEVPPLRDRRDDIPLLADHFLALFRREESSPVEGISSAAMDRLVRHDWPGNVRELRHAIHRAVVLCEGRELLPRHLPFDAGAAPLPAAGGQGLIEAVEALERTMIRKALEDAGWNRTRAAERLGITRRILGYKMTNLGIRPPVDDGTDDS
jgi:DNA-binding NtrC family response regulator